MTLNFSSTMDNLTPPLIFTVSKNDPLSVSPATRTPNELKFLSDIDDQQSLRTYTSCLHITRAVKVLNNPVPAFLDALRKALVFYYPVAGRLRELPGRKLAVDCNAAGIVFVEADANFTLHEFSPNCQPPFPCLDQLVHGVGADYLTSPLLFMQLTRLRCGGLILSYHMNHTVVDGTGIMQFLKAVREIASGAPSPSVSPVWARELLMARDPPRVTHDHHEYDDLPDEDTTSTPMVVKSFFFGPTELAALRQQLPPDMKSTRFEILTACLWRCRVAALEIPLDQEVRVRINVNVRRRLNLPEGYYGNALAYPVAMMTAGELIHGRFAYTVELVKAAKESITKEYLQSVADLMVLRGRPRHALARTYRISDATRLGFEDVNFGWGEVVYSGPAVGYGTNTGRSTNLVISHTNVKGEEGMLVLMTLPAPVMERFQVEVDQMLAVDGPSKVQSILADPPIAAGQGQLRDPAKIRSQL